MTPRGRAALRRRKGKGLLPPNPGLWDAENHGVDLREQLKTPLGARLSCEAAFQLLSPPAVIVPHGEIPAAAVYVEHFRRAGKAKWSGMALPLDGGATLVVYNDSHSPARTRATLMEEFFHLRLGHRPSTIRLYDRRGRARTHDSAVEKVAYASGAAALVPYRPLKALVEADATIGAVAKRFDVSTDLVVYRAKVTKLYAKLMSRAG